MPVSAQRSIHISYIFRELTVSTALTTLTNLNPKTKRQPL
ncbi:hypothetical protein HMPREF0663_10011 [Hoylesella oralis ATCC 33269]|uniref:Uncharacterized protein n=1 Tax=Hoylesella oralis ATCC 33269 TaxID=873533 RepID=E7RLL1_9BACT|nr:hypothetical protein HMPREF0663_10011 [Hoylesella oralis ATCC 33269]